MTKYNGLKKKWHKTIKAEFKELGLPEPAHEMGFTDLQLHDNLSCTEYHNFWRWMYGQTLCMDENGKPVVYIEDVLRGVRLIRFGTPTYWD
jgi:hypothetical protein